jgi:hypothetical protein
LILGVDILLVSRRRGKDKSLTNAIFPKVGTADRYMVIGCKIFAFLYNAWRHRGSRKNGVTWLPRMRAWRFTEGNSVRM